MGYQGLAPPYLTLITMITRPTVRSQAYGYSLFFVALGGIIFGRIAGVAAERIGLQQTVLLLGGVCLLGGLVALTIPKFVRPDVEAAASTPSEG